MGLLLARQPLLLINRHLLRLQEPNYLKFACYFRHRFLKFHYCYFLFGFDFHLKDLLALLDFADFDLGFDLLCFLGFG